MVDEEEEACWPSRPVLVVDPYGLRVLYLRRPGWPSIIAIADIAANAANAANAAHAIGTGMALLQKTATSRFASD